MDYKKGDFVYYGRGHFEAVGIVLDSNPHKITCLIAETGCGNLEPGIQNILAEACYNLKPISEELFLSYISGNENFNSIYAKQKLQKSLPTEQNIKKLKL